MKIRLSNLKIAISHGFRIFICKFASDNNFITLYVTTLAKRKLINLNALISCGCFLASS
jgi:hypothetical protein